MASLSKTIRVKIVRLPHARDLELPAYQSVGAAGLDLVAAIPSDKPLNLKRGARILVPTGLVLELPPGTEAQVRPRSGLALKHGITVLNTPGTIDSDYRGEVQVILVNLGQAAFKIQRGERIAQMIVAPVARAHLVEVATARASLRGAGGFGSTGVAAKKSNGQAKAVKSSGKRASKIAAKAKAKIARKKKPAVTFPRRAMTSKYAGRR
jgi:dUTP pyrophosphatase